MVKIFGERSVQIIVVIVIGAVILLILSRVWLLSSINSDVSKVGETPGPIPTSESLITDKTECKKDNREWIVGPFGEGPFCNIPQPDEGKTCTDGRDCLSGKCLAENNYSGKCAKFKTLYGCYSYLKNGTTQRICAD